MVLGPHKNAARLETSYLELLDEAPRLDEADSDDELPPTFYHPRAEDRLSAVAERAHLRAGDQMHRGPEAKAGGISGGRSRGAEQVIIHFVPEKSKSRWSHIEDLDSFFKNVYAYHREHGFKVMLLRKVFDLGQVFFVVSLTAYLMECILFDVLFNQHSSSSSGSKLTLSDVMVPLGTCAANFSPHTLIFLMVGFCFCFLRLLAVSYQIFHFWDIKMFYNQALGIDDSELSSLTWHDVQNRLIQAQAVHQMCIHKQELTGLDIYHRILRWKNYMVALVNKGLMPVKLHLPLLAPGGVAFLSQGLKYNMEWLFFKGPWAPFDKWHLKDDYRKVSKRHELTSHLKHRITLLATLNLVMMPLILVWQLLYCFFNYADIIKREPGSLGVRKWSEYGRLYLRHFNELDHELMGRLNRAYKPASRYMEIFISPTSVVVARFVGFIAGSVLAIFITLSVWDEDVLNVEHVLTLITVLGAAVAISRAFIPDENLVFCPERMLTSVIAHIHYFPEAWKGQAHTERVMNEMSGSLFPYTATWLLHELLSPILTPFILFFCLRPKSVQIIDFFRNFTVDVVGVGDVCSFAQMDVRKHGNPTWHGDPASVSSDGSISPAQLDSATKNYTQAEDGKTEMSLINFTLTNPEWKVPDVSEPFLTNLHGRAAREAEALPTLTEELMETNALFSSLNSLQDVLPNMQLPCLQTPQASAGLLASVHQGLTQGRSSLFANSHLPSQHLPVAGSTFLAPPPNLRQDLRRLGLEYTAADMSLSALYLHEMHHRISSSYSAFHRTLTTGTTASMAVVSGAAAPDMVDRARGTTASLAELDEEEEVAPLIPTTNL